MAVTATDTSVLVAALLTWHESHAAAFAALSAALERDQVVVPASALVEAYAVMTRLPAPHRLSPRDAAAALTASLRPQTRLVGMAPRRGWVLVERLASEGIAGGAAYDRRIVEEARAGGAGRILTLNATDFERFAAGIAVVAPGRDTL